MKTKPVVLVFSATLLVWANSAPAQRAVIALNQVEIYSLPIVNERPVAKLIKGDTVRVVGRRGNWVKVQFSDDRRGWMPLQVEKPGLDPKQNSGNGKARSRATGGRASFDIKAARPLFDEIEPQPQESTEFKDTVYRRFGYAFGMGLIELDYTYNWKFVFHSTPRLALEGSFKHVLGNAADSYFIMANLSYLLRERKKLQPFVTGGLGVINTVPDRSIGSGTVSNMAVNYGLGARRLFKKKLSFMVNATQYTTFVAKGIRNYREITIGVLVGKFQD